MRRFSYLFGLVLLVISASASAAETKLADAAESKDWSAVSKLVKTTDVNQQHPDGMTALHWAVYYKNSPIVTALLAAGADANAKTEYQVTPLSLAASAGDAKSIAALLDAGAKSDQKLPGKVTPLLLAARNGNVESIQHLVEHGAQLDAAEQKGQTPLMWAAEQGNVEAVDFLLEAGADPKVMNKGGFTAMMFAAREGRLEVVQLLIEAGVDPRTGMEPQRSGKRVPRNGSTALTLAVESGHFELAMQLIDAGADPNDQRNGYTPLHAISWVRKPNRGEEPDGDPPPRGSGQLSTLDFVRELVDAGADVNLQLTKQKKGKGVLNTKGATPLLLASKRADLPLIKLLIELGADPTITNADGCTALMAAAGIGVRAVGEEAGTEEEVLETVAFFVDLGLDVNAVDKNKETAMHGAAYRCYPKVVAALAGYGADPAKWNHKNKYGWTPRRIGEGYRPGSFKPHPPTIAAVDAALK